MINFVKNDIMNIQTEKLGLIEWISKLNDSSIIEKLKSIKEDYSRSRDWWDSLNKEELDSIERGLKDLKEGKVHSHETARNVYEKYL
jgi:predicted transcriptional regulator